MVILELKVKSSVMKLKSGYGEASTGYEFVAATLWDVDANWLYCPPRNVVQALPDMELSQKPFDP